MSKHYWVKLNAIRMHLSSYNEVIAFNYEGTLKEHSVKRLLTCPITYGIVASRAANFIPQDIDERAINAYNSKARHVAVGLRPAFLEGLQAL